MSRPLPDGGARVAGVCGQPIAHSLSPLIHNAWIAAAGLDAAYVPFAPPRARILPFLDGLRGGALIGLNVTAPFKETAALVADRRSAAAAAAGAANLLLFPASGEILADNTDGLGVLYALARQTPDLGAALARIVILGAGGAARGALLALWEAGARDVRLVNRTLARAQTLADLVPGARAYALERRGDALEGATLVVNALSAEAERDLAPADWAATAPGALAFDMVYRPLRTRFLTAAGAAGLAQADGLDMLIGQAVPSFERFFGAPPPDLDVRALALAALTSAP